MFGAVRHIFFDLDDTLWDFEANSTAVLKDIFLNYSLSEKLKVDFEIFYKAYKEINNDLWLLYNKREIDKAYLRNNRFHITFKAFGYENYPENMKVTEEYLDKSPHGKQLKEGCLETLDYLKDKYQLHIITNGFQEVQNIKLDSTGLRPYFKEIIISEEHSLTKPDEKIFRLAEDFTGSSATECVMVGDNYYSDITGALNAGWKALWLNDTTSDDQIPRISQLNMLKSIF
jgi:putative hydrolase of the HAD superfamily